ncbi:MAG: 50S ribosomal protein L24 [Candidatus Paceibacterota bacterium]|jgi:large subunit ribosomal protein L24
MHVKKGDKVIVIAGKEKGKTSTVIKTIRETNKVVLEGLNMMKKHTKAPNAGEKGGIVSIAMPIDASNVKLADKSAKKEKPKVVKKTAKKAE